jgi:hypothetical protein
MDGCEDVLFGKRAVIEFLTPGKKIATHRHSLPYAASMWG